MAQEMNAEMEDAITAIDKSGSKFKKEVKQRLLDVAKEVNDLTNKVMPEMLTNGKKKHMFDPMTQEQAIKYSDIFAGKEYVLARYLKEANENQSAGLYCQ